MLYVLKNLLFSVFFLLTPYEVCLKFNYYNIWGVFGGMELRVVGFYYCTLKLFKSRGIESRYFFLIR